MLPGCRARGSELDPKLLGVILKQLLFVSQGSRALQGAVVVTFQLLAEHALTVALRDEGRRYAEQCRSKGRNHNLGPSHHHVFLELLEQLATSDVGAKNREILTKAQAEAVTLEPEQLSLMCEGFGCFRRDEEAQVGWVPAVANRHAGRDPLPGGGRHWQNSRVIATVMLRWRQAGGREHYC